MKKSTFIEGFFGFMVAGLIVFCLYGATFGPGRGGVVLVGNQTFDNATATNNVLVYLVGNE